MTHISHVHRPRYRFHISYCFRVIEDGIIPKNFWSGTYDVYDPEKMGFVSSGPEAERYGFRYDTHEPGNSNAGHVWGTDLSPEEKKALIEFLKTL